MCSGGGSCCRLMTADLIRRQRSRRLQKRADPADLPGMNTLACRAVTRAALSAGTASLDDEAAWPLLLVAGWLATAADLMLEAGLAESLMLETGRSESSRVRG